MSRPDPRPSPTPGQIKQALVDYRAFGLKCPELGPGKHDFIAVADIEAALASSPLPAAGLSVEALEAAERATATAEKLIDAIERISGHLNNDKLADRAKINKARTVIAGLDVPFPAPSLDADHG